MSATISEHDQQRHTTEKVLSRAEAALLSVESQIPNVGLSETSLPGKKGRLELGKGHVGEQCRLLAQPGCYTHDLLDRECDTNLNLR